MSCKYKSINNKYLCNVIHGECQFQVEGSEPLYCPILGEYKDFDKAYMQEYEDVGKPVKLDVLVTQDVFDSTESTENVANILDIPSPLDQKED